MPISAYPSVVEEFLPRARGGFSKPQLKQFARYLTGLIVCDNKTVTGINDSFVGHNDQSALNNWLTDSGWSDEKLDEARKGLVREELDARNVRHGALILDDTINHKSGRHMEGVNIHFDHAQGRHTLGHQLVTSHLVAGRYSIPLGFELYRRDEGQPGFKSKNEMARSLIAKAVADGFSFDCVVMDAWYLNFENTSHIEGLGRDWVAGCKVNRLIQTGNGYVSLADYLGTVPREAFKPVSVRTADGERGFLAYARNVTLKKHRQRVRVLFSYEGEVAGEPKVLATNRLDWDVKTVLETYLLRWKIDAFYRDAKQELGLEDYEVRKLRGLKRHWLMVFLADTLLQLNSRAEHLVERVKGGPETVGSTCRHAATEVLRSFISLVVRLAQRLKTADEILRYALSDLKEFKTLHQMEII